MSLVTDQRQVLSPADIEHFLQYGYIRLSNCFDTGPGSLAHRWAQESWQRNGIKPDDFDSWPKDKIHMSASETRQVREFSPRAYQAICELSGGAERIEQDMAWGNGFIANYGFGRDKAWEPPSPQVDGWHVDGDFFHHFLDSAEQGLLIVVLFSDIHPKGGGTYIATDSIAPVARHLAAHPEGLNPFGFAHGPLTELCKDCIETTGKAGDVFFLHPFMLHTSSYNHRPEARLMINPTVILREPMRFDRRSDGTAYSPVEQAILRALGAEHYPFTPRAPRIRGTRQSMSALWNEAKAKAAAAEAARPLTLRKRIGRFVRKLRNSR